MFLPGQDLLPAGRVLRPEDVAVLVLLGLSPVRVVRRPRVRLVVPGPKGGGADALHVVIKGSVEARDEGVLNAVLGPKDSFDSRALVHGAAGEDFTAAEETLCFLVPKPVVMGLISRNPAFAAFFDSQVADFTRVNHASDPIPIVPGRLLGFAHPHGEVHLLASGIAVACAGDDDATDALCTDLSVPNVVQSDLLDHLGPYEGVFIGTVFCD